MSKNTESSILKVVNEHIENLQNRRMFLIKQLEIFENADSLNKNGKEVVSKTNDELDMIKESMGKLLIMKEYDLVKDLANRMKEYEQESSIKLSVNEAVQDNLDNMV